MIDPDDIAEALESARSSGLSGRLGLHHVNPRDLHDANKVKAIIVTFLEGLPDGHTIQEILEALR